MAKNKVIADTKEKSIMPNYNSFHNFNYLDLPDCYDPV